MQNGYIKKLANNFPQNCSNCEKLYPNMFDLPFKAIIESFE